MSTLERETSDTATEALDVLAIGAGFSGVYAAWKFREMGMSVRVLEAGDGIGGTWFWNCYPGARCDVESLEYSYSFSPELEQEWEWTERYPRQPEILAYINHVADRFDLWPMIQLNTRVTSARYDETTSRWTVGTEDGSRFSAKYLIMGTGCISKRNIPPFAGLESFEGDWYHTGAWPKDGVDFTGKRVAAIGTGSTGIQVIPQVAKQAEQVFVLQRTPNFSVPAQNGPLSEEAQRELKARYREHRQAAKESSFGVPVEIEERCALDVDDQERQRAYEMRWELGGGANMLLAFADLLVSEDANETAAEFVRNKIRATVKDPDVAEMLCPHDHPLGTKRICVDTEYYDTYNRPNVKLVNVRKAQIAEITPSGIRLEDGQEFDVDAIVFATGYDTMTGALFAIDIRGRDGLELKNKWEQGPKTYLGLTVAGFPNMFTVTGPGSPSVLSNMVVSIEQHVDWVAEAINYLREHDVDTIEAQPDAEAKWVAHVAEVGNTTLFPRANSWYTGANIPGKVRVFYPYVGGVGAYRQTCDGIAANGYEGFSLSMSGEPATAARG